MRSAVNILGAGLAGLSAAISLAQRGLACRLISAQPSERAQSVLAEGGINAALNTMGEDDSPAQHCLDTLRGGVELADPNAVAGLAEHAPEIVAWLCRLGAPLNQKDGRLILRNFGGQKKKRTAYAKSSTGKVLMTALIDETRKWEAAGLVTRYPRHRLVSLRVEGGVCRGLTARDDFTGEGLWLPGPVILCSGGMNDLLPGRTTGTVNNTGDGTAQAFLAGAALGNLEFLQYHPTTVGIPGKRMLISEAARGEGGRLMIERDGKPWYFMEELYPELGNLMPRDVISREIVQALARPDTGDRVYLDLTELSRQTWEQKLSDLREEIVDYLGIDPAQRPVAIEPGIHYFMGGVLVDEGHHTTVSGLFAAGECACQYHGANRLGGNSMLGAIYGGRVAAASAAEAPEGVAQPPASLGPLPEETVSPALAREIGQILWEGLGILRDGPGIARAQERLEALGQRKGLLPMERRRLALATAMLESAQARRESRGAHTRTDAPRRDDEHFRKTTVATWEDGGVRIHFADIPERREQPCSS